MDAVSTTLNMLWSNQVAASFAAEGAGMSELKQWNDLYGEGGSRKQKQLSYFLWKTLRKRKKERKHGDASSVGNIFHWRETHQEIKNLLVISVR